MQYSVHHVPCVHMAMILSHFLAAVIKINSKHLLQLVLGKKFCGGDLYYKLLLRYFLILCSFNSWLNVCLLKKPQPVRKTKQTKNMETITAPSCFWSILILWRLHFKQSSNIDHIILLGRTLYPSLKGILTLHYIV